MKQNGMVSTMFKDCNPARARLSFEACCLLSGFISIFIGIVSAEGKDPASVQTKTIIEAGSALGNSRNAGMNRRDPFKRLGNTTPAPKLFSPPPSNNNSEVQDPEWKLLGVIHGQDGHLAIIQISPKERVVLQAGSELAQTGWWVKNISDNDVVFEHPSQNISPDLSSPAKSFVLSFPLIPYSP